MRFFGLFQKPRASRFKAVAEITPDVISNTANITVTLLGLARDVASDLARHLPTEQDTWWFLAEQYDRCIDLGDFHRKLLEMSSLKMHEIEYEGRRSETSYVGKPNPGILFLNEVRRGLTVSLPANLVDTVITQAFVLFAEQNMSSLGPLRIKYATHFHNNCVKTGALNNAEHWSDVIDDIEAR